MKASKSAPATRHTGRIENAILVIRGQKVMLDEDLATLYEVPVKVLNQAVRRNQERFPADFVFRLSMREYRVLRSQIVTLEKGRGRYRKYPPLVFTEQGVAMLSSVLRSPRAVAVNIEIMRAFVRMRRMAVEHADIVRRIDRLERRYDSRFRIVFDALRCMMTPPDPPRRRIGFGNG
jgi:hypothetical protein